MTLYHLQYEFHLCLTGSLFVEAENDLNARLLGRSALLKEKSLRQVFYESDLSHPTGNDLEFPIVEVLEDL